MGGSLGLWVSDCVHIGPAADSDRCACAYTDGPDPDNSADALA